MSHTPVADLSEALMIPPGGIASRPLLEVKGSTKLVLFALDTEQEISPHQSPFPAEILVLRGRLEVLVGEALFEVVSNGRIDLPMGAPHGLRALEPTHFLLTMLRGAKHMRRHGHPHGLAHGEPLAADSDGPLEPCSCGVDGEA